ncbi:class Ib ribonucleoside-diphosphate reductase assembly flavoprotein NrdI [Corynebacterium sp. 320]|uniref:Protein NrdI n=1 Tax=Corynebacterium zhongnanshanii TaxID=2768834 RepID=A0ABQ6VDR2_9CORY|nr:MULTISPECIES: class Ib ribonucleoside-diphosphate reductase assembly flavoprotein NrdI [Corynebacterium]KAB1501420.1 class Ib ribonucleoside-diphosphate reductase assembly flavoprotein NrdI [Corynebacterium sp. 320]KAB1551544.1 class Ib ribonucleoside-diphosphate reductase assembly flavoprotein NrdI [Corynebacterium sp. 321]KAB1551717.1 class Ib ribonucleoside-diphosphate reductase assembly flavoprotein NrdI [Corynebacterium sp. 319]KAB3520998.1 class Ib ribonucleoside-diphosphate reductase 
MLITYFSSTTLNTHRFVQKLGIDNVRIPLRASEGELIVDQPHVLIVPTYGGGASISGDFSRPVPKQVIRFLNNPHNRGLLRGVIASGNLNFGPDFCKAGEVIAAKCKVPYLYRFELMGTDEDVVRVQQGLAEFEQALRSEHRWGADVRPSV